MPTGKTDFTFKVITGGDGGVGKTTLLRRYVDNKFEYDTKMTIGVDIFQKTVNIGDKIKVSLQLWDFGGQERFRFFLDSFVLGAKGALILFDLTQPRTISDRIKEWVDIVRKYDKTLPLILVGAKADLTEKISVEDNYVLEITKPFNFIEYVKTSSKSGLNVSKAFEDLLLVLIKQTGKEFLSSIKEKYDLFSRNLL